MASVTLAPIEEYLSTIYEPDREYLDGEVMERNMGEAEHGALQGILVGWLFALRKELGIHVFPELRVQVSERRYRVPDILVTTAKVKGRIVTEPPFLCIEILSPEDRAGRMEAKIDDYLAMGVAHVWVIDPRGRNAWTYTQQGKRETAIILTTGKPHIRLPLNELFAELAEQVED